MMLTPQRMAGESFDAYRQRRANENAAVKNYLRRGTFPKSWAGRAKLGKAETKRLKRERVRRRRAAAQSHA